MFGSRIAPADICVMTRTRGLGTEVAQALTDGGLDVLVLGPDTSDDPKRPGVRVATMHRAKGLEFQAVALVRVEEGTIPVPSPVAADGGDHDHLQQERCLLYVAGSRARERLSVTWTGKPSPLLPRPTAVAVLESGRSPWPNTTRSATSSADGQPRSP
ncbi:MAG TPA: 3'-5' exonuclease [Mycobacteriales bacterium]